MRGNAAGRESGDPADSQGRRGPGTIWGSPFEVGAQIGKGRCGSWHGFNWGLPNEHQVLVDPTSAGQVG